MLYYFLRYFNWLFIMCGLKKPFTMRLGQPDHIKVYNKCWSLLIITIYIALYVLIPPKIFSSKEKYYLGYISSTNDVGLNLIVFLIDVLTGEKYCNEIYCIVEAIIAKLNVKNNSLMYLTLKIYFWIGTPVIFLLFFIATEIIQNTKVKISLIRAPITIALLHLSLHLCIVIAILNSVNKKITRKLKPRDKYGLFVPKEEISNDSIQNHLKYIFEPNVCFIDNNDGVADNLDMKDISLIYYDLCRCFKLLEKQHGFQVLCDIWINFTDGVILVCLLTSENVVGSNLSSMPWFLLLRCLQPFIWHMVLAWLSDQIRQEVERMDTLLIKSTIDYRNDKLVSNILDSFSAQVRTNQLKFRACDLFYIDYATILGTFVSVVTYSIIIIQLFIEDEHI